MALNDFKDIYIKEEPHDIKYEDIDDGKYYVSNEEIQSGLNSEKITIDENQDLHANTEENDEGETLESTNEAITTDAEITAEGETPTEEVDENICKICRIQFQTNRGLQTHVRSRRLGDKCFKCCLCNKTFRDNTQLNVHARKHTGEKPYQCTECGKRFSVNGNLNKHMRIHTGERRFECDTCERKFTQFAHLEDHMKIHTGDRPYKCDFCNTSFKTKSRLKKHKLGHSQQIVSKRAVNCPACSIVLRSAKQLEAHMHSHTSEEPDFECDICFTKFKGLYDLHTHKKLHDEYKVFKCTLCSKPFASASHLRRHENTHAGIKPFSCDICSRAFPSLQNLNRHTLTHTGEKPYSCDECGRNFLTLENLNRHKRIHTGEKPFSCDVCNRAFAHSTTLKEHKIIHTGEKPFGCSMCDRRFTVNKMLYRHIRVHHPESFPSFKQINDLPRNMKFPIATDVNIKFEQPDYVECDELINKFPDDSDQCDNSMFVDQPQDDIYDFNSEQCEVKEENEYC